MTDANEHRLVGFPLRKGMLVPRLTYAYATTLGAYVRSHDRHVVDVEARFFAVADGDNHHGHAADLLLDVFAAWRAKIVDASELSVASCRDTLDACIVAANDVVFEAASTEPWRGCGASVTCFTMSHGHVVYAHVGDARLYLWRAGTWRRITRDDTLVEEVRGRVTRAELEEVVALHGHVVTKVVGAMPSIDPEVGSLRLRRDDCLLLCTDGAWGGLDPNITGAGPGAPPDSLESLVESIISQSREGPVAPVATALAVLI